MSFARLRPALRPLAVAVLCALGVPALAAEASLVADTYVSTAAPGANYGATASLNVGGGASALLRFDLSNLPAATAPANVQKATLVLYVNRISTAGAVEVQALAGAWSESAVSAATVPANERSGSAPTAAVSAAGQYITLDVSDKVRSWIAAGNSNNFGLLVQPAAASPATVVVFDSKENTLTGHGARLDLTLSGQGPAGAPGLPGLTGLAGASTAVAGPAGPAGPQGAKGDSGIGGAGGANGALGPVGAAGAQGATGPAGAAGSGGATGPTGPNGAAGATGAAGAQGDTGATGPTGLKGVAGSTGPTGLAGTAGANGASGTTGPAGAVGAAGAVGVAGPAGARGATGATGATGAIGPMGAAGATGSAGAAGAKGAAGVVGAAGAPGATGDIGQVGATGPRGATGAPGPAALQGLLGEPGYSANAGNGVRCTIGETQLYAGNVGNGLPADGRLLRINENDALFNLIGTDYGGDGLTTFALPNLRAVTPNGLQYYICDIGYYPSGR